MKANETIMHNDWTNTVTIYFEHGVCINEESYLLIFGHHINGGFIGIPSHGIACEVSDRAFDVGYNTEKLQQVGLSEETARGIAEYIDRWVLGHVPEE